MKNASARRFLCARFAHFEVDSGDVEHLSIKRGMKNARYFNRMVIYNNSYSRSAKYKKGNY